MQFIKNTNSYILLSLSCLGQFGSLAYRALKLRKGYRGQD
jgi:hypothetical protein